MKTMRTMSDGSEAHASAIVADLSIFTARADPQHDRALGVTNGNSRNPSVSGVGRNIAGCNRPEAYSDWRLTISRARPTFGQALNQKVDAERRSQWTPRVGHCIQIFADGVL
jgi:hypothetical protein